MPHVVNSGTAHVSPKTPSNITSLHDNFHVINRALNGVVHQITAEFQRPFVCLLAGMIKGCPPCASYDPVLFPVFFYSGATGSLLSSIILWQTGFVGQWWWTDSVFATVSLHLPTYPVFLSLSNQHSMQRVGSATDEIEKPVSRLYYREHTVAESCDYKIVDSGGLCFQLPPSHQHVACARRQPGYFSPRQEMLATVIHSVSHSSWWSGLKQSALSDNLLCLWLAAVDVAG